MVNRTNMTYGELRSILHDFEDLVADKHYEKMQYYMWRSLMKTHENATPVHFEWDESAVEICIGDEPECHHFAFGDNSFADFLHENFLSSTYWDDLYYSKGWNNQAALLNLDTTPGMPNLGSISADTASYESTREALINTLHYCGTASDVSLAVDTKVDKTEFNTKLEELTEKIQAVADNINKKEKNSMNGFKFDFGPANTNTVRMSMYGLAVKNKTGTWVSYDAKTGEIMDVDIFNFEGAQFIWRMPVAIKDIAIGDVVVHQGVPMFVVAIPEGGKVLTAVDPVAGERKDIMLARSPFGFNFATKVVNFLGDMFGGTASADNPFGNMWMLMAMQGEGNSVDTNMLVPMMLMNQGNMDPTMMMVVMAMGQNGGKMDMNSMLPMLWAMQNMNKPAQHICQCGQHNQ